MGKNSSRKNNRVYVNRDIRAKMVRCLSNDGENIGVIHISKALKIAEEKGLDLVQMHPGKDGPPVCKILDYGKYKFDTSKRQRERAKKQRESAIKQKEIKFRPNTDSNDLQTKAKLATKFISDGCRVKVSIRFKGREMSHKFIAEQKFEEFLDFIDTEVVLINQPTMDGKSMVAILGS